MKNTDQMISWQPARYLLDGEPRLWANASELNFVMIVNVIIANITFTGEL